MQVSRKIVQATLATIVGVGVNGMVVQAQAAPKMEKCYGVVKKGKNDCGTSKHACAGQAATSGNPNEWLFLPKGTCDKIVGGSLKPGANDKQKDK